MKKKTRKKVVRRKRRSRKSMSEKRVMQIKRGLMKGAKKLRLGAKRTGAYVYGTLRRIVGNPGDSDLIDGAVDVIINTRHFCGNEKEAVRDYCFENKVSDCKGLYRMAMAKANSKWNAYRREAGVRCVRRNPYVSKILGDMKSQQLKYRGFTIILERQPNTILATWTDGDTLQSQRYSGYSFAEVYEVVKDEIDDRNNPSRPGMLRGNPRLGKYEQKALDFAKKYPGWHGFNPRKHTADAVRRLAKKGLVELSDISNQFRAIRKNPPMYAHGMTAHRTHGLSLKQMMKLYRLVSSGNPKAVMYARRTLGIPMSESLSQVKAVVYHHVLDLKGKI